MAASEAFNATQAVNRQAGCAHCQAPLRPGRAVYCDSRCRLADWEDRNPRLREGATLAEVRAVLRAYLRRRLGRGRFHLRH